MSVQSEDSGGSIRFDEGELIERFAADCTLRGLTPESIRGYKGNLRIVSKFLNRNGLTLVDLNRQSLKTVLNYLTAERGVTPQTVGDYQDVGNGRWTPRQDCKHPGCRRPEIAGPVGHDG